MEQQESDEAEKQETIHDERTGVMNDIKGPDKNTKDHFYTWAKHNDQLMTEIKQIQEITIY